MNRFIIPSVFLFLCVVIPSSGVFASSHFLPQPVVEVAVASFTVTNVNVSTTSSTQIDSSTNVMGPRTTLEIFNPDATANLYCGDNQANITPSALYNGRKITPGSAWDLGFVANTMTNLPFRITVYCISDKTAVATSSATITQAY
jgi:hypothetical protein